ncbi:MAG: DUF1820 family protein [Methylacidiphilales bacterium]|nr:DUF1820 family protein [Candidatus Methylacidiphilales bacterium]
MQTKIYRIKFKTEDSVYELFAHNFYQADLFGFVVIEGITFTEFQSDIIANPSEEKLREEFKFTEKLFLPLHSILRVEQVSNNGLARIVPMDSKKLQSGPVVYSQPPNNVK